MPLHPQARALVEAMAETTPLDFSSLTIADFRAAFIPPSPVGPLVQLTRIEDRFIDGGDGSIGARFYYPDGVGPFPITLYFHGSAFVIGNPDLTDGLCRALAREAETLVISVDYRLAPEAPFPAAIEDAVAALRWAYRQAGEIGGIASKIAVAGDSAGGTVAAVLAQKSPAAGIALCHQLLFYPPLDARFETESYRTYAEVPFLPAAMMQWAWRHYLDRHGDPADPDVSPLRRENLAGLPDATIFTAEYDILRDEAEDYALALARAGVATTLKRWIGQPHAFMLLQGVIDDADAALQEAARYLRAAFTDTPPR